MRALPHGGMSATAPTVFVRRVLVCSMSEYSYLVCSFVLSAELTMACHTSARIWPRQADKPSNASGQFTVMLAWCSGDALATSRSSVDASSRPDDVFALSTNATHHESCSKCLTYIPTGTWYIRGTRYDVFIRPVRHTSTRVSKYPNNFCIVMTSQLPGTAVEALHI